MSEIAAVDIGGSKIAAGLFRTGVLVEKRKVPTPRNDPTALVHAAAGLLKGWRYAGIGVATTGYVAACKVYSINLETLSGWNGFPLESALRERLGFDGPMLLLNDASAGAWAEFRARDGKPARLAFITVSTGVGGGLVLDGRLQISPRGLAGHFGHMRIADTEICGCGRIGCVEAVASGTAIARIAGRRLGTAITTAEAFERAESDRSCADTIEGSARAIADLGGNLRMALDIDAVAIGGSVGLAEGYLERVRRHMRELPAIAQVAVEPAICRENAGLIGVALLLAESRN